MTSNPSYAAETKYSVSSKQTLSAAIASILGWSLDLFDLFTLLYVAPVIAALFFPLKSSTLSLASVYASFAVTLLMRPAGSAIFGTYADKQGRKKAMMVAIIGVGVATACLGLLPTYPQVGVLAPVIFLVVRLVQGVFVGGVVASTHTIGTETIAPKWRGLLSGLIGGGGAGIGAFIASVAYLIISNVFPGQAFNSWGWRVMFFVGILSTVLGLFVFRKLEESPIWLQHKQSEKKDTKKKTPLKTLFSGRYLPIMLINIILVIGGGASYYLTSGYLPTFLSVINHVAKPVAGEIMMFASLLVVVAAALVGHLSEIIGRKKTFFIIGILNLIAVPLAYSHLAKATDYNSILLYTLILSFLGNAAYAPILVFLNERFPTAIRASGTGLSWNVGFAIGGMMPTFVTLASSGVAQIPSRLEIFMVIVTFMLLLGAFISSETKGRLE